MGCGGGHGPRAPDIPYHMGWGRGHGPSPSPDRTIWGGGGARPPALDHICVYLYRMNTCKCSLQLEQFIQVQMLPGPATTTASFLFASLGFGGAGYWAQQVLWAVASSCPDCQVDCQCNCNCAVPSAGPEVVLVEVSLTSLLQRQPEVLGAAASFVIILLFAAYFGGKRRGAQVCSRVQLISAKRVSPLEDATLALPEPVIEIRTPPRLPRRNDRRGGDAAGCPRAIEADLDRRSPLSDPLRW